MRRKREESEQEPVEASVCVTDETISVTLGVKVNGPEGSYSSAEAQVGCTRALKAGDDPQALADRADELVRVFVRQAYRAMLKEYRTAHGRSAGE